MAKKKLTSGWVLHSASSGYFEFMSNIGPACTRELEKAHVFDTKHTALSHPARSLMYAWFIPIEVEAVWV